MEPTTNIQSMLMRNEHNENQTNKYLKPNACKVTN